MPLLRRWLAAVLFVASLGSAGTGYSQDFAPNPALVVTGNVEWISAGRGVLPADTDVNPDNVTFRIPQASGQSELLPHLRLELGSAFKLVLQPRFLVALARTYVADRWQDWQRTATAEWTQLYGSWSVRDNVSIAYGLQNFQWGPGELV